MKRKAVISIITFFVSLGFKYLLLAINGETTGHVEDIQLFCLFYLCMDKVIE